MSIIHEALKKVQSNRSQNNKDGSEIVENPSMKETVAPSSVSSRPLAKASAAKFPFQNKFLSSNSLIWSAIILALSIYTFLNLHDLSLRINDLANLAASSSTNPAQSPRLTAQPTSETEPQAIVPATNAIASTPPAPIIKPQRKKGEIILSGITSMDGKNFALINDGIYETGEIVEGATITRITDTSVILFQRGNTKILKVTHQ